MTFSPDISDEQRTREDELVERVLRSFDGCQDPRLDQVLRSLVRHLHGFLREVRLTEAEWQSGIDFLTAVGHITDATRQEFVLLSDVLGASMQTIAMNNEAHGNATEATVFGPFFVEDAPRIDNGGDITFGAKGQPCWVEGTVTDAEGNPVSDARLDVWEADDDGFYDVQYAEDHRAGRAQLSTDKDGTYRFWAVTPTPYPIPHDGPVGRMLAAMRPVTHARVAPALHGDRAGCPSAGDSYLRARGRVARLGRGLRREGVAGQGVRKAAARHTGARRPSAGRRLDTGEVRHCPRTFRAVRRAVTLRASGQPTCRPRPVSGPRAWRECAPREPRPYAGRSPTRRRSHGC